MITRNTGKSINISSSNNQSSTFFNFPSQKTQSETSKDINIAKIKSKRINNDRPKKQFVIWEEDYNKLMKVYQHLEDTTFDYEEIMTNFSNQLQQYSTQQLLFKSQAPLWTPVKSIGELSQYFDNIIALTDEKSQAFLIQSPKGKFLSLCKDKKLKDLHLMEGDQIAVQLIKRRKKFFIQFQKKFQNAKNKKKLSQFSQQIVFLNHEYKRIRDKIIKRIKQNANDNENGNDNDSVNAQKGEVLDKIRNFHQLIRQLRNLKKVSSKN